MISLSLRENKRKDISVSSLNTEAFVKLLCFSEIIYEKPTNFKNEWEIWITRILSQKCQYGALTGISWRNTSLWRHNDVFRQEIRVIAAHMLSQKNYKFDPMHLCLFSVANTFIVFAFKTPLILTIYGHVEGDLNFFNYL